MDRVRVGPRAAILHGLLRGACTSSRCRPILLKKLPDPSGACLCDWRVMGSDLGGEMIGRQASGQDRLLYSVNVEGHVPYGYILRFDIRSPELVLLLGARHQREEDFR